METKLNLPALTIGRIVHYKLAQYDVDAIKARRTRLQIPGNDARAGDVYPAMVVRTWGQDSTIPVAHHHSIQLQVFLDGEDTFWATSRYHREDNHWHEGTFSWPTVEYPKAVAV